MPGILRPDHSNDPQTSEWHLDKRLNVGIIIALTVAVGGLLVNSASFLWWSSSFSTKTETRLESAERRLALAEDIQRKLIETQSALATQLATQTAATQQMASLLAKLDSRIDSLYAPSRSTPGGR